MIVAHRAGWGGKGCACDGEPQVPIRITVAAGKMRTGEPEDGLDLRSGFALRQQIPGDPQIHDAPVRLRKAVENMPSLQTTLVGGGSLFRAWAMLCGCRVDTGGRGWRVCAVANGLQQPLAARRPTHTRRDEFHPRSDSRRGPR